MAKTKSELRRLIRNKNRAWPDDQVTVNDANLDATTTDTVLSSGARLSDRCLLQIGTEIIQVRTFVTATGVISSMIRGARGSTAAAHANGATVYIYPEWAWCDVDLDDAIDQAVVFLSPEVWFWKTYENTFLAGFNEFGLPSGVVYPTGEQVKQVEFLATDGVTWVPNIGWSHKGDRLMWDKKFATTQTVRIKTAATQAALASDGDTLSNDAYAEAIVLYSTAVMMEDLVANRVRYLEYSATLNDRASTPDELQRTAYYFRNQAIVRKDALTLPKPSGFASARRKV